MNRIISTCLTAAIIATSVFASVGFAKDNGQEKNKVQFKKILVNEEFGQPEFISGKLTLPSKNKPESIVKDFISKKNGAKDFVFKKQFKNDQKQTVIKTHQTFNGIKVKGTQQSYIVGDDGVIETVSGLSIPDIGSKIKGSIKLKEKDALDIVKKDLKRELQHSSAEKMILPKGEEAVYTYEVKVSFDIPYVEAWGYVIDAFSGKVIEKKDILQYQSVVVDGKGVFGDDRIMNGHYGTITDLNIVPDYPYSLVDVTKTAPQGVVQRPFKILTYELLDQSPDFLFNGNGPKRIVSDDDGHFVEDSQKYHAVDAHYHTSMVYDFYKSKFGRYSYDNQGTDIISNVHAVFVGGSGTLSKNNACWDPVSDQMYFGDGDNEKLYGLAGDPETTGHEITHAVIGSEVYLQYKGESGAINESLADLFAEAFETYVLGTDPDWLKLTLPYTPNIPSDAYLDYKNPKNKLFSDGTRAYPDHMNNKYNGDEDICGVHINAAILTKAYSLMSDGGTFHNVNVKGIGIEKLTKIMYKVITEYLANYTTDFNEFVELTLTATEVLYGEGSEEYNSVKAGFKAVGIPYDVYQWKLYSVNKDFDIYPYETAMTQVDNRVYAFGGVNEREFDCYSDVWEYNSSNNKWTRKNNMSKKRAGAKATTVNGKAYVLFGYEDSFVNTGHFTTVDEYDPASDQWRVAANLPEKPLILLSSYPDNTVLSKSITKRDGWFAVNTGQLASGASVTLKIQGSSDNINFTDYATLGTVNTSFSTTVFKWREDISNRKDHYRIQATVTGGTCPFEVNAPYIREGASVISYNGKIYILGGQNEGTKTPILTMDVYDTVTNQWTKDLPGLEYDRTESPVLVAAVVNSLPKIYVFGGGSGEVEVYDINSGTWNHSAGTSPDKFASDIPISGVNYKGKIHFLGNNGATYIFDPVTGSWSENYDIAVLSYRGINPVYNNSMYNISIHDFDAYANLKVEKFDPLRINAFENDNAIVVQWSKYGNDSNVLSIDGATAYSGTGENYRYTSFVNASKKHIMKVTQNHPVYGSVSSKNLCTAYQKIGDIDGNNVIDSADVALLKQAVLEAVTLTDEQKVAADIYKDNDINSIDYSILQRYVDYGTEYHSVGTIKFMIYGDVNDDGDIDFKDHDMVYKHVMNDSPLSFAETVTADVNGDGLINSIDLAYIVRYINTDGAIFEAVNK